MADNITIEPRTQETIAYDDIGGVKYPRMKLVHGSDGSTAGDVAADNPIPMAAATDHMYSAGGALTPKFVGIAVSASGNNQVIAAVGGKKLRVLSYILVAAGTVSVKFRSASTDKTGAMPLVANSGIASGFCQVGHFETAVGEALNLNLSDAIAIGGHVTYIEV